MKSNMPDRGRDIVRQAQLIIDGYVNHEKNTKKKDKMQWFVAGAACAAAVLIALFLRIY